MKERTLPSSKRQKKLVPTQEQDRAAYRKFVEKANPHSWWLSASNLHQQAAYLRANTGHGNLTHLDADSRVTGSWDHTNKSVFLLSGFVVENMIKAFLVFENPQWVSNGKLARNLRSHSLTRLEEAARTIPLKGQHRAVLSELENGLDSWARYPCGLSFDAPSDESVMSDDLWEAYRAVMQSYESDLQSKLSGGRWQGPHGFSGKWEFISFA